VEDTETFVEQEIIPDIHKLGQLRAQPVQLAENIKDQFISLKEENSKLHRKLEELQADQASIMVELDTSQTQFYSDIRKLQDNAEVLQKSFEKRTKGYLEEIKRLTLALQVKIRLDFY
jgi:hypothetical protein